MKPKGIDNKDSHNSIERESLKNKNPNKGQPENIKINTTNQGHQQNR